MTILETWPTLATASSGVSPYTGDHVWTGLGPTDPVFHGVRVDEPGTLTLLFLALIVVDEPIGRHVDVRVERFSGGSGTTRSGPLVCFSGSNFDTSSFYSFDHRHSDGSTRLMRVVGGSGTHLDTQTNVPTTYPATLRLVASPHPDGVLLEGYIGEDLILSAVDPDPLPGTQVGMKGSLGGGSDTYWGTFTAVPVGDPEPAASEVALRWDVRRTVGSAVPVVWQSWTHVTTEFDVTWDVQTRQTVGRDLELTWASRTAVAVDVGVLWQATQTVSAALDVAWATQRVAAADLDVGWSSRATSGVSLPVSWAVAVTAGSQVAVAWRTMATAGRTLPVWWDVQADTTVGSGLSASWITRAIAGRQLHVSWQSRSRSGADLDVTWRTSITAAAPLVVSWATSAATASDLPALWEVRSDTTVGRSLPVGWEVRRPVGSDLPASWAARRPVSSPLQVSWPVRTRSVTELALRWDVYATATVAADLGVAWQTRRAVTASMPVVWSTYVSQGASLDVEWSVFAAVSVALPVWWTVESDHPSTVSPPLTVGWVEDRAPTIRWVDASGASMSRYHRKVGDHGPAASIDVVLSDADGPLHPAQTGDVTLRVAQNVTSPHGAVGRALVTARMVYVGEGTWRWTPDPDDLSVSGTWRLEVATSQVSLPTASYGVLVVQRTLAEV